ncbi:endonuclease/exonuclease/phosphatase family protein [bacterium]|nr:endonuclease/exonuclease/phosphatase family protein [bacterium]
MSFTHHASSLLFRWHSLNWIMIGLIIIVASFSCSTSSSEKTSTADTVRVALFNIWEMSTTKLTHVDSMGIGQEEQLIAAAKIIRNINPDVLVINEIDHDIDALEMGEDLLLNLQRFKDAYLSSSDYKHMYVAPCNTGFLAGMDFDNNGLVATEADRGSRDHGGDCYGYGAYPGQYSMAILSRYPLVSENARTFQKFLWKDLPNNLIPDEWYSDDEIDIFRLSSKSHWDVPVKIGGKVLHLLVSHPTPPGFDGKENRNGRRNYDEIKMWVHYINDDSVMVDDSGKRGGLARDQSFIILGDLNASPRGDTLETGQRAIDQLLKHPRIRGYGNLLISAGALNGRIPGPPKYYEGRTAGWGDRGMRIDHILPSWDLEVLRGAVYWPDQSVDSIGAAMAKKASDHRMIWLDIKVD